MIRLFHLVSISLALAAAEGGSACASTGEGAPTRSQASGFVRLAVNPEELLKKLEATKPPEHTQGLSPPSIETFVTPSEQEQINKQRAIEQFDRDQSIQVGKDLKEKLDSLDRQ